MSYAKQNRYSSYLQSESNFNNQESKVIDCLQSGINDAWSISSKTGMLITSVRRCLTDLKDRNEIQECGTMHNIFTNRNVTTYKIVSKQLSLI